MRFEREEVTRLGELIARINATGGSTISGGWSVKSRRRNWTFCDWDAVFELAALVGLPEHLDIKLSHSVLTV